MEVTQSTNYLQNHVLTLENGCVQTTLTLSHFCLAVTLLSLSVPNIRTPFLLVPLRLSSGLINADATSKTCEFNTVIFSSQVTAYKKMSQLTRKVEQSTIFFF